MRRITHLNGAFYFTIPLMFYVSVFSGIVYRYSHPNKKIYIQRETIVWTCTLLKGGQVNFNYLPPEWGTLKKKGGGSMMHGQVFLKDAGGGRLELFLFNFFKVCHFYI